MKKIMVILQILMMSTLASAEPVQPAAPAQPAVTAAPPVKSAFPLIQWTASKSEPVKIENGNGANLMIQITVSGTDNSPGIIVQNCGKTTYVKAGSSAICTSNDANNPVMFASDSALEPAMGTYQITEK